MVALWLQRESLGMMPVTALGCGGILLKNQGFWHAGNLIAVHSKNRSRGGWHP